jgi:hypothetical protein
LFLLLTNIIDDGGRHSSNAMQALAKWLCVAFSEAWYVLDQEMHPSLHRCINMAIKITSV